MSPRRLDRLDRLDDCMAEPAPSHGLSLIDLIDLTHASGDQVVDVGLTPLDLIDLIALTGIGEDGGLLYLTLDALDPWGWSVLHTVKSTQCQAQSRGGVILDLTPPPLDSLDFKPVPGHTSF